MAEKTEQLEDALVSIAAFMAGTNQQPPAPAPLSMEQQFAAFVAAQQRKEAPKEQSTTDKAVARALGELNNKGGGGGGGPSGNSGTKRTRKPSKRCIFYCFSHGCNFSHNGPGYKEKKTGHSDAATYTNPGLGKMWNKDIYTGVIIWISASYLEHIPMIPMKCRPPYLSYIPHILSTYL
jgi:hypothetical protein